jgi:hypothetical protein
MFKILISYKRFVIDLYLKQFIFQTLLAILIHNILFQLYTGIYSRQNLLYYYSLVYKSLMMAL